MNVTPTPHPHPSSPTFDDTLDFLSGYGKTSKLIFDYANTYFRYFITYFCVILNSCQSLPNCTDTPHPHTKPYARNNNSLTDQLRTFESYQVGFCFVFCMFNFGLL